MSSVGGLLSAPVTVGVTPSTVKPLTGGSTLGLYTPALRVKGHGNPADPFSELDPASAPQDSIIITAYPVTAPTRLYADQYQIPWAPSAATEGQVYVYGGDALGWQLCDSGAYNANSVNIGALAGAAFSGTTSRGTALGHAAAQLCTAIDVVAVGYNACALGVGATGMVAVGSGAMDALTTGGGSCVAVGYNALGAMTEGSQNTCVGYNAANALTKAVNSCAFGETCLGGNGSGVTAIGSQALKGVGLDDNTALGYAAGTLFTGGQSVLIGSQCLDAATDATLGVVAIGYNACGKAATTAGANSTQVVIGSGAVANAATLGTNVTIVGGSSAPVLTGISNVVVGDSSADIATTMDSTVIVGSNSGSSITTADQNVLVGAAVGNLLTGGTSVVIGYNSGSALTSGAGKTILGSTGGSVLATGSNNILIGNATKTAAAADAGCIVIGSSAAGLGSNTIALLCPTGGVGFYCNAFTVAANTGAGKTLNGLFWDSASGLVFASNQ